MDKISIDKLLEKVDSKYTLVVAAAKRARSIMDGEEPLVTYESNKPVSIALKEIQEGKITYRRIKSGIK